ncbi:hypothetical protein GQ600_727 [Phytophthora cactorum]|nr:hypothetical protein GQ600_727 [Phytophthora cactorum]
MHVKPSFFRARQASQQQTKWTSDHVDSGGKSSMGVLLDWLAAPGNYDRWRSCTRTKESLRPLAARSCRSCTLRAWYTALLTKMTELENSYREAAERLASTNAICRRPKGHPRTQLAARVGAPLPLLCAAAAYYEGRGQGGGFASQEEAETQYQAENGVDASGSGACSGCTNSTSCCSPVRARAASPPPRGSITVAFAGNEELPVFTA